MARSQVQIIDIHRAESVPVDEGPRPLDCGHFHHLVLVVIAWPLLLGYSFIRFLVCYKAEHWYEETVLTVP